MSRFPHALTLAAVALVGALLGGCIGDDDSLGAEATPLLTTRPQLTLATSREALATATSSDFNFARLRDLWVRVTVPAAHPGVSVVRVAFINPRGEVFHEQLLRYSPDPAVQTTTSADVAHRVPVRTLSHVPGGFVLDFAVPIVGSTFMRYPQPGTWMVRVSGAGLPTAIVRKIQVIVKP
jgi:hypothetical protein